MTITQLLEEVKAKELEEPKQAKKSELIALLRGVKEPT
jgi:hypothetical protein